MRSLVLTGGDHAGKTELAGALGAAGFRIVPEAALQVIEDLVREHGLEGQRHWRSDQTHEFQARVARRQLELEATPGGTEPVVLDRGLPDGIAYCRLAGVPLPPELRADGALRGRYSQVAVLDTITPFDARSDTGRANDLMRSHALRDELGVVYRELGYAPIQVPQLATRERVRLLRTLFR